MIRQIHDAETDEESRLSPQHSQLESQGEKKTTSKQRLAKISVSGHPNIISPVKWVFFFGLFSFFLFLFVRLSRGLRRLIANHVYARRALVNGCDAPPTAAFVGLPASAVLALTCVPNKKQRRGSSVNQRSGK